MSGNYRPNPAAYNSTTSNFDNNGPAPGNYASTVHATLGNAAIVSFDNVTYDVGSNAALAASNTVGTGSINTTDVNNPFLTGILSSTFTIQGLTLFLTGQLIPNDVTSLNNTQAINSATGATYTFTSSTNLNLIVPVNVPISIDVGGGTYINGNAFGQIVGNASVPEPSTFALAGLGLLSMVAIVRRRRGQSKVA